MAIVFGVLYVMNYLSEVLLPFFIAWFFAYLLNPAVLFVQNKLHVKIRALAIIITMVVVIACIGGIVYLIIPPMVEQFEKLSDVLTRWLSQGQTADIVISIIGSCIVLLYMFFILLDYEYLSKNWVKIFPRKHRPFWHVLMGDVKRELNNYVRGQGLVALCMGIMYCIGFDFPMAIGLGILIGIMDLVPYLHTFALIPTAFLAMLKAADTGQSFWYIFGMAFLVFAVVQIITDMIVTPKIMGKAMGLNPAILLLSLSIWGALLGFIGLIVALPLTTLIIAYWQRYITKEYIKDNDNTSEDKANANE